MDGLPSDHDLLITLNVKMDVITVQLATHMVESSKVHGIHDARITLLEQWKWRWAGAVAAAVIVVQLLIRFTFK